MRHRALVIVLSLAAVLLFAGVVMFAFGTPQAPPVSPAVLAEEPPRPPATTPQADGEVPAPDPASPLAIEIPGCRCHSDDPAIVEEHAQYRMNQCFGCHAGGMPEMGR